MNKKIPVLIFVLLLTGFLYRLILTSHGNFIFNMDNARDMVDVREMVVLKKIRLTGPTSAIDGLFNGPAWYYLLAIPFTLSGGNPYASIIMEIILWAIGGYFLLKLIEPSGKIGMIAAGVLWIASDYVVLTNLYAFNPNPIILLTPLFIYLLTKYIESGKLNYSIFLFFLSGLFFNFEMNFGFFILPTIVVSLLITGKINFLKKSHFWKGFVFFAICLLPQFYFDLRHQFIMSHAVLTYLSSGQSSHNLISRSRELLSSFFNVFSATLENQKGLTMTVLLFLLPISIRILRKERDNLFLLCLLLILTPFVLHILIPTAVNPWHLGAEAAALILLTGLLINKLLKINLAAKLAGFLIAVLIIWFSFSNLWKFFTVDINAYDGDPSRYRNEISAIDYIYRYAGGKNFKVYTYLPSVIDYPYQYLIWWYGRNKFGYLPADYAYSPNKPEYISNKQKFSADQQDLSKRENSNLVFLLKQPDFNYTRAGWEGAFIKLKPLDKKELGPYEIDIRQE